ncbi:MAG: HAD-IA family hydrolase [Spirochaetes bacterium]|nr:HAD-IA family hydrolase [Spirochaetota bacterium]
MKDLKIILFDLGGVLIELTGVQRVIDLTMNKYSVQELWEKWLKSPSVRAFESGKINPEIFAGQVVAEFGMDIHPSDYLNEFTHWPGGKYPGADELLLKIKSKLKIGSLSNTNELHWKRFNDEMDLIHHFDYNFPSHLTSFLKPDVETYLNVIESTGVKPEEILFFDDNEINVTGAMEAGINAVRVENGICSVNEYLEMNEII